MKSCIIHINKLGPIENQVIELAPVMFFTGESNLGKSYVNFLSYYVYKVFSSDRLFDFLLSKITQDAITAKDFSFKIDTKEIIAWMSNDVRKFFAYLYNYDEIPCDVEFEFENVEDSFEIQYKEQHRDNNENDYFAFEVIINKLSSITITSEQRIEKAICRNIVRQLCQVFMGGRYMRTLLLPPGRASLLTGDFTAQRGSSRLGLYDTFLQDNDWIDSRALRNGRKGDANDFIVSQIHSLIKGDLISEKEGLYLQTENGKKIPLGATASSIKELTPLLQWILGGEIKNYSVCIEEPEAHLHPEMQIAVADLLASCINQNVAMQITTHSDYFLQRVNQLLKYGIIRERDFLCYERLCKETGHKPEHFLDKNIINAYYFSSDKGNTVIEPLNVGENGIPLSTFFDAVKALSLEDEMLDEELEKLNLHA